jgi:phage shock protein PspC (stress-responsive transcriptional regulator)
VLGAGLIVWGGWWLLNSFLAPLLWPLRAVLDVISRVGWPLAIIAMGVLVIVAARRGGQVVIRGRKLYRSRADRVIGGVLGGAADYLGMDATLLRVIYAALAVFTSFFPAFVLYVIAMAVVPEQPEEPVATVVDDWPSAAKPPTPAGSPAAPPPPPPAAPPTPPAPTPEPPNPPAPAE